MYPDLFGINNLSYTLCMILGISAAFLFAILYLKKTKITKAGVIDLLICGCFAISSGIIFSILFENFYELIQYGKEYRWVWKMTFFGGLFGGVGGFLLTYFFMRKNCNFNIVNIVKVAPPSIAIAHGIGRIGCFLAGCCHGKETGSWIGIDFPNDGLGKVIPTQLIEAIFLVTLFIVMAILLIKFDFKYNFVVYMIVYAIFRFIIEFYRGDERGVAFALSPSQFISIILFVGAVPTFFLIRKISENAKE